MSLSTAERNRRKRERKKKERAEERQKVEKSLVEKDAETETNEDIEYVPEELPSLSSENLPEVQEALQAVERFHQRAAAAVAVISEDESKYQNALEQKRNNPDDLENDDDDAALLLSKRKIRDMLRPSVADLKRRVARPDLVEAHDVTAPDPDFLIRLKTVPGTVPVPRHWGRKRKYLQGKRGFEKPPFRLPAFLVQTGITELRDTLMKAESEQSAKQKNRARVTPKLGAMDVDYATLHAAFFKHQTKPNNLTKFGDLYYEAKELEQALHSKKNAVRPGQPLSPALRAALGLTSVHHPPPWLLQMQRFGPPPSYPSARIPGLTAPLPSPECQYGFHPGGWGHPPFDVYGRPLYGGNPLDPPGSSNEDAEGGGDAATTTTLVTSDGKTISKATNWGALPEGTLAQDEEEEEKESSSEEEMEESEEEEEEEIEDELAAIDGMESTLPPPSLPSHTAPVDLRKTAGIETPLAGVAPPPPPKQLYQVLEQRQATATAGEVFASEVAYALPTTASVPEGAESVLSKAVPATSATQASSNKRKRKGDLDEDDDEEGLGKNFKF